MKAIKRFWRGFINALKQFWNWLKQLFGRKKPKDDSKEPKEQPKKPEEPKDDPRPVEPVIPEEGKVNPYEKETLPTELNLEAIQDQDNLHGFIRIHEVDGRRIIQEHFQSLEHLVDCLSARNPNFIMGRAGCIASDKSDSSFSRTSSYKSAVQLMRGGYTDILPRIEKGSNGLVKNLIDSYQRKKSTLTNTFSGALPSVPRHLMGLPDSMLNRNSVPRKTKTVHIVYATHAPWHVSGDVFIKAGIALLSAIQLIESSGISVKLDCIFYGGRAETIEQKEAIFGIVPLKDYSNRLNLQKLCFPIAHPAMLRRIGFKFLETVPGMKNPDFTDGYGSVISDYNLKRWLKTNSKVVILSVESIQSYKYNVEKIIKYIRENAER